MLVNKLEVKINFHFITIVKGGFDLIFGVLSPLSTIFQLSISWRPVLVVEEAETLSLAAASRVHPLL